VSFVGGPNAVFPGSKTSTTMRLEAGNYVVLCLIPDKPGVPHVALGMEKPLLVTPAVVAADKEPVPDLIITRSDFHFSLSKPVEAGTHTIQVLNAGSQPHEAVVVKLTPGATAKDFIAAFEPGAAGPPPGQVLGGIVGLDRGGHGFFQAHFEQASTG
jgi:hypothetical protein